MRIPERLKLTASEKAFRTPNWLEPILIALVIVLALFIAFVRHL